MGKGSKKPLDRDVAEGSERLPERSVDAPDTRFQTEQQAAPASETAVKPEVNAFVKKPVNSKGSTLRQEVVAEVLSNKSTNAPGGVGSVISPATAGLRAVSFSGDTGTILGNTSGTPSMEGSYQGRTRVDKRLSDANKDMNFNASEQVLMGYDNIPPLAASKSTVGYNGNPKNVAARSQKKTGFTAAEMLYDRSLDFIEKDGFVFTSGQVVKQGGVTYDDYPTITYNEENEQAPLSLSRGNYAPRELVFKAKKSNGKVFISSFEVLEDDISANNEKDQTVNKAGTNHIIDMNRAELARQTIDADAGSPNAEHFNPLGRSIDQPTKIMAYLQDVENVLGATVFTSYKFANKARAHFLNRTAKDGQDLVGPAIDALYGHLCGAVDLDGIRTAFDDLTTDGYFSKKGMRAGSAALMIPLFDSDKKYRTKADLVNQPRGLKMHLQTADNNMNPFRCKKEFVAALNSVDAYSTIDHEYDPTMPVNILDNVRLVNPYSWHAALQYTRDNNGVKTYQSTAVRYFYAAGSGLNTYTVTIGEPVLNGIAYFLELHANEILDAAKANSSDTEVEIHVPIVSSTTHFSLWDLLVCASTPYIIYERTNSLKDILDYEMFYKYPFQGNVSISEANPLDCVNYGSISPFSPIAVKQMLPSSAIRWKYPEMFTRLGEDVLMPMYFNERQFDISGSNNNSVLSDNGSAEFTTPVVRAGIKLAGLDDFFSMEVLDQLLITDRMVRLPISSDVSASVSGYFYKYGQDSDGLVVLRASALSGKTAIDYASTPRLLGWYFDAPAQTCQSRAGSFSGNTWVPAIGSITAMADINLADVKPSFRAVEYKGIYASSDKIISRSLDVGSVNVNRAQAFTQVWGAAWAGQRIRSKYFDLLLSFNEGLDFNDEVGHNPRIVTELERTQFSPYTYGPYAVTGSGASRETTNTAYSIDIDDRPIVFSPHAILWAIIQKMSFVINPFENSDETKPTADPFGLAYVFGLAGFMAADYNEELYNRQNEVQNQGYGYTQDPMTIKSPVFKDAFKFTQIG